VIGGVAAAPWVEEVVPLAVGCEGVVCLVSQGGAVGFCVQPSLWYVDVCVVSEADLVVGGIVGVVHLYASIKRNQVALLNLGPGAMCLSCKHYHQHHHYQRFLILVICYAPLLS